MPPGSIVLDNCSYDNAIIGTTFDGRVIYDFDLMIEELMNDHEFSFEGAIEWIECNTVRALPYAGSKAPIIVQKY